MDTDTITIPVPTKLVQAYREAPPQEKRKWELLVRFQLEGWPFLPASAPLKRSWRNWGHRLPRTD